MDLVEKNIRKITSYRKSLMVIDCHLVVLKRSMTMNVNN
ncbi:hypothetical protein NC99_37890 [Sunxiuqinia dokdonensis]|uniref:Uncharacterized protein n=1 Tax=Sunxiuqinia dokdonensis TaxID=1409788 RepID=A0A0L8V583_9BACT|nr:hypothetical protein NC99_37890 [Sunxiuqinia dokdonensis]